MTGLLCFFFHCKRGTGALFLSLSREINELLFAALATAAVAAAAAATASHAENSFLLGDNFACSPPTT